MNPFPFLRPFIGPAVAPFIGAFLAWLQVKYHVIYTPEQVEKINEAAVTGVLLIFAFGGSLAGIAKVFLNKWLNKANAATTELTAKGNAEGAAIKGEVR